MNNIKFSIVIPCYNEQGAIARTVKLLRDALNAAGPYELIIVNDGSSDGSREILEKLSLEDRELRVVHHDRNRGYGAALKTGIRRANSEVIVITDSDGTYPNERIPELAAQVNNEIAMVVGARTGQEVTYSKIRKIPKLFMKRYCSWIAGQDIPDFNSGLRAFRKSVAERYFNILPNGFSFTTTITLALMTNYFEVRYIPINYAARIGKSKIKPIRDTLKFFQLILRTGIYFAPLRVLYPLILFLMVCFLISLAYDVFVLEDLTDKTILLLLFGMNTGIFALLADMIDKRIGR